MSFIKCWLVILVLPLLFLFQGLEAAATDWGGLLDTVKKAAGQNESLSTGEIADGLKEALEIGTENAVKAVGKTGGYTDNSEIKIPLPGSIEKVRGMLTALGYGSQVDEFDRSMNRAAEIAAPKAKAIFWDSIKQMTFSDAKGILNGGDTAATDYLKKKSSGHLEEVFRPIIHNAMGEVGVTRKYQALAQPLENIPFAKGTVPDLDGYVTDGALKGLFYMLGQEEKKIRENPAARATDLLKKVFGGS
ncbi:MAG: DUF4197 domain-containing protein [Deltaproteobacteria bacterium]|nr:DUF4197 domain-containing protein [Deltaproteobacteria bacterium]